MYTSMSKKGSVFALIVVGFFLIFLFLIPSSLNAQTAGLTLVTDPSFPPPHTETKISLDDYSLNTIGSNITWYVDGVEQEDDRNERSIQITTGAIGKSSIVRVILSRPNSPSLSASRTIKPTQVDIVLESNTYTPHFYLGRALPTRDSLMRAIAIVNDGSTVSDSSYVYSWSIDSSALEGGALKGKNVLDLEMPHYDDNVLGVEVFTTGGELVGQGGVLLMATEPELHFYEYNPLRGLSEREVTNPLRLLSEETTIYGEPYFIDARMNETEATFSWSINNESVTHDEDIPNALTLRHVGGEGSAMINFDIVTEKVFPQFVRRAFQVIFE